MKKKSKIILISIILISIIVISIVIFLNMKKENIRENESEETRINFVETKKYEQLEFKNTRMMQTEDKTSFMFDVLNNSDKNYQGGYVKIKCKDKDNNDVGSLIVYVPEIKPNEQIPVSTSTDKALQNIHDFIVVAS